MNGPVRRGFTVLALLWGALLLGAPLSGCDAGSERGANTAAASAEAHRGAVPSGTTRPGSASAAASAGSMPPHAAAAAHDPSHPPIDCPLRKAGIDPTHLKPFADVEKYIAFLDRPDRAAWQKPDALVASLKLAGNETVADVGAGSGYFTFRFARALPRGRVVAIDVEPEMVRHIHHHAMTEGFDNVHAELASPSDPELPRETNLIFVCDVLHHVADRAAWLGKMASEVAAGTRLVVVEFKEGKLPEGPPASAKIPEAEVRRLVTAAGFRFVSEDSKLLPYQVILRFERAG